MNKEMLNKKESRRLLAAPTSAAQESIRYAKKGNSLRRWYKVYAFTALLTLVAVLTVLLFGVSERGDGLLGELSLSTFADKVAEALTDVFLSDGIVEEASFAPSGSLPSSPGSDVGEGSGGAVEDTEADATDPEKDTATGEGSYDFDYSVVPEGKTPIIPMDLSLSAYGDLYFNNSTEYTPNAEYLINAPFREDDDVTVSQSAPRVLIIHTHTTEAYSEDGQLWCDSTEDHARSNDPTKNVVAVGKVIADVLNQKGIPTVHCAVVHDGTQYRGSYSRAEDTIKRYLEEYPSIELVIDVHRDAIVKSNGELVRAVTEYKGSSVAQLMCVVGSDFGGDIYPDWENNLALALKLRAALNGECAALCRPVTLRPSTYNQELSRYSILLEVGSSGNSIEEAKRAAEIFAGTLYQFFK